MSREGDDRLLLHALADDELDAAAALALERRLAAEPLLAAEYEQILAVKAAVKRLERPSVSAAFSARIASLAPARSAAANEPVRRDWSLDWRAMAASLLLVAALSSSLTYGLLPTRVASSTEEAIVSSHRRALLASSPVDVASSDRHTVRPWLDAKLGVAPPAPDLAAKGFPLIGGRVEVIGDQPVPTLVYRHKEHLITVVAVPQVSGADETIAPVASTAAGYNIVRWAAPGFRYWAVSDLDAAELGMFVDAMRDGSS